MAGEYAEVAQTIRHLHMYHGMRCKFEKNCDNNCASKEDHFMHQFAGKMALHANVAKTLYLALPLLDAAGLTDDLIHDALGWYINGRGRGIAPRSFWCRLVCRHCVTRDGTGDILDVHSLVSRLDDACLVRETDAPHKDPRVAALLHPHSKKASEWYFQQAKEGNVKPGVCYCDIRTRGCTCALNGIVISTKIGHARVPMVPGTLAGILLAHRCGQADETPACNAYDEFIGISPAKWRDAYVERVTATKRYALGTQEHASLDWLSHVERTTGRSLFAWYFYNRPCDPDKYPLFLENLHSHCVAYSLGTVRCKVVEYDTHPLLDPSLPLTQQMPTVYDDNDWLQQQQQRPAVPAANVDLEALLATPPLNRHGCVLEWINQAFARPHNFGLRDIVDEGTNVALLLLCDILDTVNVRRFLDIILAQNTRTRLAQLTGLCHLWRTASIRGIDLSFFDDFVVVCTVDDVLFSLTEHREPRTVYDNDDTRSSMVVFMNLVNAVPMFFRGDDCDNPDYGVCGAGGQGGAFLQHMTPMLLKKLRPADFLRAHTPGGSILDTLFGQACVRCDAVTVEAIYAFVSHLLFKDALLNELTECFTEYTDYMTREQWCASSFVALAAFSGTPGTFRFMLGEAKRRAPHTFEQVCKFARRVIRNKASLKVLDDPPVGLKNACE